jgi:hypothetical protein
VESSVPVTILELQSLKIGQPGFSLLVRFALLLPIRVPCDLGFRVLVTHYAEHGMEILGLNHC